MTDPYEGLATRFIARYDTSRGAIRETLVADQLSRHLPTLKPGEVSSPGRPCASPGAGAPDCRRPRRLQHGEPISARSPSRRSRETDATRSMAQSQWEPRGGSG